MPIKRLCGYSLQGAQRERLVIDSPIARDARAAVCGPGEEIHRSRRKVLMQEHRVSLYLCGASRVTSTGSYRLNVASRFGDVDVCHAESIDSISKIIRVAHVA